MKRRYGLQVVTDNAYLTVNGGSIMFTGIATEFAVSNEDELRDKVVEFLSTIAPHSSMETGLDKEAIEDRVEDQRLKREQIEKFIQDIKHMNHSIWSSGTSLSSETQHRLLIELDMVDVF